MTPAQFLDGSGARYSAAVDPAVLAMTLLLTRDPAPDRAAADRRVLRVCADPDDLPYSNALREGFENRLAELIAADLGRELEYVWGKKTRDFDQPRAIAARRCDVVFGAPRRFLDGLVGTRPYGRTGYAFVTLKDRRLEVLSLSDERLRDLRLGVEKEDSPTYDELKRALAEHGLTWNVREYSPPSRSAWERGRPPLWQALEDGEIDVALAWQARAVEEAKSSRKPLEIAPARRVPGDLHPLTYDVGIGVREGGELLRDSLDLALESRAIKVEEILERANKPPETAAF